VSHEGRSRIIVNNEETGDTQYNRLGKIILHVGQNRHTHHNIDNRKLAMSPQWCEILRRRTFCHLTFIITCLCENGLLKLNFSNEAANINGKNLPVYNHVYKERQTRSSKTAKIKIINQF